LSDLMSSEQLQQHRLHDSSFQQQSSAEQATSRDNLETCTVAPILDHISGSQMLHEFSNRRLLQLCPLADPADRLARPAGNAPARVIGDPLRQMDLSAIHAGSVRNHFRERQGTRFAVIRCSNEANNKHQLYHAGHSMHGCTLEPPSVGLSGGARSGLSGN